MHNGHVRAQPFLHKEKGDPLLHESPLDLLPGDQTFGHVPQRPNRENEVFYLPLIGYLCEAQTCTDPDSGLAEVKPRPKTISFDLGHIHSHFVLTNVISNITVNTVLIALFVI